MNKNYSTVSCTGLQFRCEDALQCIDINSVCDGHVDCTDQSDEADCEGMSSVSFYAIKNCSIFLCIIDMSSSK